jgi:hypothetical protein
MSPNAGPVVEHLFQQTFQSAGAFGIIKVGD